MDRLFAPGAPSPNVVPELSLNQITNLPPQTQDNSNPQQFNQQPQQQPYQPQVQQPYQQQLQQYPPMQQQFPNNFNMPQGGGNIPPQGNQYNNEPPKKKNKAIVVIVIVLLLLCGCCGTVNIIRKMTGLSNTISTGDSVYNKVVGNYVSSINKNELKGLTVDETAEYYHNKMLETNFHTSRKAFIKQVQEGNNFSEEEASAAVDKLNLDYNQEASLFVKEQLLASAPNSQKETVRSTLEDFLFTSTEIDYAISQNF